MKFELTLSAGALALALAPAAWAEDVVKLSDVLVKESSDASFASSSQDAQQTAAKRASTSDAASLLKDIPGVSLYTAGGVSSLPAIHGLADDRLRIKVDGMDLMAACPNHMNPPLSYLDTSQITRVAVWAGLTPVSVGGDSIGGTIAVETAPPEFAAAGQPTLVKGQAGAFYRSNGDAHGVNAALTIAGEDLSVSYSGSLAQSGDIKAGGDFKTTTATGQAGHALPLDVIGSTAYKSENHLLTAAYKTDSQLFEAKIGYQHIPYELYPNQRMDMLGNTQNRYSLRYAGEFDWGKLDAQVFHETVRHHMDFGEDKQYYYGSSSTILAPGMPMDTQTQNTGAHVQATIGLNPKDALRVGGDLQHYHLNDWWPPSPSVLPSGYTYGGMAPNVFWNIADGNRDRLGVFGEWESRLTQQWTSLLGARFERVKTGTGDVQGYNNVYAGYVTSANAFNALDRARTDNNRDVSALARYVPGNTKTIEFGYSMKTRSPNLYERYSWSANGMALEMNDFVGDGNGYLGNPDLKPEVAHSLSATLDLHAPDRSWEFKATPYYTLVDDYIDAIRCAGSGTMMNAMCAGAANATATGKFVALQYANQSARLYGIDLSGHMPIASTGVGDFGLKGLVNYINAKNRDTGDALYNTMPLNTTLTLTHQFGGWDNGLEFVAVKAKNDVSDVRNEIKTPGYSLVNLRGSYAWKQVRVDFGIENLFDRFYYLPTGGAYTGQGMTMSLNGIPWGIAVPGAGRSIYTSVSVSF